MQGLGGGTRTQPCMTFWVYVHFRPYIMDLESVNRTKLNSEDLPPARYVELRVSRLPGPLVDRFHA